MTKQSFVALAKPFRANDNLKRALLIFNTGAPYLFAALYAVTLAWLAFNRSVRLIPVTGYPALGFLLVSLLRSAIKRPRPFAALGFEPLIKKGEKPNSMPSRHVYSAFALGTVWLYLCLPLGIVALVVSALLAACRVVVGVHYPSDVLVGAALGVAIVAVGAYTFPLATIGGLTP